MRWAPTPKLIPPSKSGSTAGADLSGADLSGADLSDAVLVGVKAAMWRTDGANMDGALVDNRPVEPLFKDGLLSAVDAADRPAVLVALARARSVGEAQVRFTPRLALDRRILLAARRMGEGPRLIVQALDATLQYAREVELDAARVEAEAQSAGKSRFLAHMSHELRTPLNAVIGFSDAMRQELFGPVPPRYADYARSIHEAGGHLLDLINDVLDLSKIEAERYQLAMETFDARDAVSAAVALVRGLDQISVAMGQGALAATRAHNWLREQDRHTLQAGGD